MSQLRARLKDPAYARWRAPLTRQDASTTTERAARYLETGDRVDGAPAETGVKAYADASVAAESRESGRVEVRAATR